MSRWFRLDPSMMRDIAFLKMSARDFRRKFTAALGGEVNELSPFIAGPYERPLANEWRELRATVFERDNYTCTYCGAKGVRLECDHVIPVAEGGSSDLDNLATACKACNRSKASKRLHDWLAQQEPV